MEQELLERLIALQESEKLSGYGFADKLGISRSQWTKTRRGDRRIADAVLRGAAKAYPDLAPMVRDIRDARLGLTPLEGGSPAAQVVALHHQGAAA